MRHRVASEFGISGSSRIQWPKEQGNVRLSGVMGLRDEVLRKMIVCNMVSCRDGNVVMGMYASRIDCGT